MLIASLCAAAPAPAATITGSVSSVTVTSGAESEDMYVSEDGVDTLIFGRNSSAAPALVAAGTCTQTIPAAEVQCPRADIVANLGAGDDKVGFGGVGVTKVEAHGGEGNDYLGGGPSNDKLYGEAGTDYIEDTQGGADTMDGGEGNDGFNRIDGADDITGGNGVDTLEFYGAPAGVFVSLNNVADDGPDGKRTANVHADVEGVQGGPLDDHLIGNSSSNELHGNGGNDEVVGGGGAFDTLRGDDGNDTLDSVNEFQDDVGCGAGTDTIRIDPRDKVDDCENVTVVGPDNDSDGSKPPLDCDDNDAAVHPGGNDIPGNGKDEDCSGADAPLIDIDQDGATSDKDCNDADRTIRPGAPDKPGDGIDQDCDGADDPYPVVVGTVSLFFARNSNGATITLLRVTGAQAKSKVTLKCNGRGCPFKSKTLKLSKGKVTGTKFFRGRRLRPGAVLELRLSAPDTIARVRRLTVSRGGKVKLLSLCQKPKESKATTC